MKIPVIIIPRTHGWNVFRAVQRFADFSSQLNELWLLQHRRNFAKTTLAVVVPIAPVTRSVHRAVLRTEEDICFGMASTRYHGIVRSSANR